MLGLGADIRSLLDKIKRLKTRKNRLLSENRKLRKQIKHLMEIANTVASRSW